MKKSEIYGLTGSITITGLLILLLFLILMPGIEKPDDEGIMVSFGEVDMGSGMTQTPQAEPVEKASTPPPAVTKPVKQDLMTQDDNSLAINAQKKKDRLEKEAIERKKQDEIRVANEKKQREQEAVNKANAMNGLFGNNNSKGSGTTTGDTRQGNPAGSGNSGGNSTNVNGRKAISLPSTSFVNESGGQITVNIRVNSDGKVIGVSMGRPTTITDPETLKKVMNAAWKSVFTSGDGEVSGTITYR